MFGSVEDEDVISCEWSNRFKGSPAFGSMSDRVRVVECVFEVDPLQCLGFQQLAPSSHATPSLARIRHAWIQRLTGWIRGISQSLT